MSNLRDSMQEMADEFGQPIRLEYSGGYEGDPVDLLLAGIRRQSTNIIDNLGITIEMGKLPSHEPRAEAYRAAFGGGRLSRLWRGRVRPILFPTRQAELVAEWESAKRRMREEWIAVVLEKGQEAIDERQAAS